MNFIWVIFIWFYNSNFAFAKENITYTANFQRRISWFAECSFCQKSINLFILDLWSQWKLKFKNTAAGTSGIDQLLIHFFCISWIICLILREWHLCIPACTNIQNCQTYVNLYNRWRNDNPVLWQIFEASGNFNIKIEDRNFQNSN